MSLQVDLQGRRAIVTGGGRGIGRAIVLGLARSGADVAIIYRQGADAARATAAEAHRLGVRALALQVDAADPAAASEAVRLVVAELGGVEILVNNAGILKRTPFLEMPYEEWRSVLGTNLDGCFVMGQAVARQMVAAGVRGAIVNITSVNQTTVAPNLAHYVTSKAAAHALTRQMAFELAPYGIRVNAVAPGGVDTAGRFRNMQEDPARRTATNIPLGRLATPEQIAAAHVFLASGLASHITGQVIAVDGGSSSTSPAGS
jgi:3-oxoacyl-[acyl-carrier protein] reductase